MPLSTTICALMPRTFSSAIRRSVGPIGCTLSSRECTANTGSRQDAPAAVGVPETGMAALNRSGYLSAQAEAGDDDLLLIDGVALLHRGEEQVDALLVCGGTPSATERIGCDDERA